MEFTRNGNYGEDSRVKVGNLGNGFVFLGFVTGIINGGRGEGVGGIKKIA